MSIGSISASSLSFQSNTPSSGKRRKAGELTPEELEQLRQLKARDNEVKAHEQAHLAALGAHKSGGPQFTYEVGPDGKRYAVGGEVPVDVAPEDDPEATIQKAQTIQRAALAPAEPSGADRAVAARATQLEAEARAEILREQQQSIGEETGTANKCVHNRGNNCSYCSYETAGKSETPAGDIASA